MKTLLLRAAVLATAAATAALLAPISASAAELFRGVINTPTNAAQPVWTVEADTAPYHSWKSIPNGTGVHVLCQIPGTWENGTHGNSNTWDFLTNGGMVPHTNVDMPGTWTAAINPADKCVFTTNPTTHVNDYTIHQAIDRAFKHLGDTSYENRCLAFQAKAFGWQGAGFDTAEQAGDWMVSHDYLKSGVPPRGALAWYHNSSGTGHIALSLGEGLVIGTSVQGKVGLAGYLDHSQYRGWTLPYFPNGWGNAPSDF
jgi:hypothetical protein